jgi:hypothetical protein
MIGRHSGIPRCREFAELTKYRRISRNVVKVAEFQFWHIVFLFLPWFYKIFDTLPALWHKATDIKVSSYAFLLWSKNFSPKWKFFRSVSLPFQRILFKFREKMAKFKSESKHFDLLPGLLYVLKNVFVRNNFRGISHFSRGIRIYSRGFDFKTSAEFTIFFPRNSRMPA